MGARIAIGSALLAGTIILALTQVASLVWDEPMSTFTRDFQVTAEVPWYTAAISVLNNMVWTGVALLSFFVAWRVPNERRRLVPFGTFVLVLAADDALLLHDAVGPNNGIPQEVFLIVYAVTAALLSGAMLRGRGRGVLVAFVLGAVLLAVSVMCDQLLVDQHLVEDGAKLLGAMVRLTLPMIACPDVLEPRSAS